MTDFAELLKIMTTESLIVRANNHERSLVSFLNLYEDGNMIGSKSTIFNE